MRKDKKTFLDRRALIFIIDKVTGDKICYAFDFGKTFFLEGIYVTEEFSKGINMKKYQVKQVKINALEIIQIKEGKK